MKIINNSIKIFITLSCVLLIGCENEVGKNMNLQNNAMISSEKSKTYKRTGDYKNDENIINTSDEFDIQAENTEERAEKLSYAVSNLKGITKSTVYVTGNIAIIGIEVDGELTDRELIKFKKEVEHKARETDKNLERVAVTASLELVGRMNNIAI